MDIIILGLNTAVILFFGCLPMILGIAFMGWQKKIKIEHQESGIEKNCFVGYAWTYFFFGFFVPIFRGEILIGFLHLIFSILTLGVFQIVMPYLYNKHYSTRLLTDGWKLADTEENNNLAKVKIGIAG